MPTERKPIKIEALRPDIPMLDYLLLDAAGASDLENMRRSPAYCRMKMEDDFDDSSQAMEFGTAVHLAILEPARFKASCGFLPKGYDGRLKKFKGLYAQMKSNFEVVLRHEQEESIRMVLSQVAANPDAQHLVSKLTSTEMTCTVRDPKTGTMCKCRPDGLIGSAGILMDVKTTRKEDEDAFEYQAGQLGYHRKMAFYLDQLNWLSAVRGTPEFKYAVILAIANTPPHECMVLAIRDDVLDAGRLTYRPRLDRLAECVETGVWPGWDPGIRTMGLRKFHMSEANTKE